MVELKRACRVAGAGLALVATLVVGSSASGSDLHRPCGRRDAGLVRIEPGTMLTLMCVQTDSGQRWDYPGSNPAVVPEAVVVEALPSLGMGGSSGVEPLESLGGPCPIRGEVRVRTDGRTVVCQVGDLGQVWSKVVVTESVTAEAPGSSIVRPARPLLIDPLDADLGNPTGLPPEVVMPAGAVLVVGSPQRFASIDWFKNASWMIEAVMPGVDAEAVTSHFAGQCGAIGWYFDPERVERIPVQNPPGRFYDESVLMIAGECRTYAGSAGDPTRRRPWFLSWSAWVRPGSQQLDVVVELRANSRLGGRP